MIECVKPDRVAIVSDVEGEALSRARAAGYLANAIRQLEPGLQDAWAPTVQASSALGQDHEVVTAQAFLELAEREVAPVTVEQAEVLLGGDGHGSCVRVWFQHHAVEAGTPGPIGQVLDVQVV